MKTSNTHIQSEADGKTIVAEISSLGAELRSLRIEEASAIHREFLWQGDEQVWSGRAPILFPIVGALRHTHSLHEQHKITLSKHGFARSAEFVLLSASDNSACFELASDPTLRAVYPWDFRLQVLFQLEGTKLNIEYKVENKDEQELLFNLGSHPAFSLPMVASCHSDYCIQFEKEESLKLHSVTDSGLLTTATSPYPLDNRSITLTENIFDHDALVFRNIRSEIITLAHKTDGQILSVHTGSAPHLGIWAKPGAEFVCIEPWWGHADFDNASNVFEEKSSIQKLASGSSFTTKQSIVLHI